VDGDSCAEICIHRRNRSLLLQIKTVSSRVPLVEKRCGGEEMRRRIREVLGGGDKIFEFVMCGLVPGVTVGR